MNIPIFSSSNQAGLGRLSSDSHFGSYFLPAGPAAEDEICCPHAGAANNIANNIPYTLVRMVILESLAISTSSGSVS
jgi:hypothetical protein